MEKEIVAAIITSSGTLASALIIGIAGVLIGKKYARERDRQDKESQWRNHSIELTKLDLEREIESIKHEKSFRPGILDFLANYHELKELDNKPLEELYEEIEKNRIKEHT